MLLIQYFYDLIFYWHVYITSSFVWSDVKAGCTNDFWPNCYLLNILDGLNFYLLWFIIIFI
jgi:hypothetical protein